jgi:hypothetical protein
MSTQFALALGELLHDDAGMLVVDVDDDFLDRLEPLAVLLAQHDARTADGELEAFAAHVLDEHGELQFATAGDLEGVVVGRLR